MQDGRIYYATSGGNFFPRQQKDHKNMQDGRIYYATSGGNFSLLEKHCLWKMQGVSVQ